MRLRRGYINSKTSSAFDTGSLRRIILSKNSNVTLCLVLAISFTSNLFTEGLLFPSKMKGTMHLVRRLNPSCKSNTSFRLYPYLGGRKDMKLHSNNSRGMLHQMLDELSSLNGGKSVNPRSPKQVSELLYPDGSSCGTDKNTLQSIISRESDGLELDRQKRIAQLILACREVMSSGSVGSYSIAMDLNRNGHLQSASFSNLASSDSSDGSDAAPKKGTGEVDDALQHKKSAESGDDITEDLFRPFIPMVGPSMSEYDIRVRSLFFINESDDSTTDDSTAMNNQTSEIDPYWMEPLLSLTKTSSRALVKQLHPHCPFAYDPNAVPSSLVSTNTTNKKETPHLSFVRAQKRQHFSDAVLLVRIGDFYECYGIDAILLVEHAGLNPMAGKARAGCPWRNVQATLDALTAAGFRVAVYEEWNDNEDGEIISDDEENTVGSSKSKMKTRYLAQVVSSAQPTYMYGMVLNDNESALDESSSSVVGSGDDGSFSGLGRSYVGVIETRAGYTLVEISAEERTAVVSERLTAEAVSCRLVAYPPADPLFYVPPSDEVSSGRRNDRLPFLPWRQQSRNQQSSMILSPITRVRIKTLPPSLVVEPVPGLSDLERAKQTIVSAFLRLEDDSISKSLNDNDNNESAPPKRRERTQVSHKDFVLINPNSGASEEGNEYKQTDPMPLHLETATQLGLMGDRAIPSLVASLLPDSAPSACKRFLRRWLLVRPPPDVADAMSRLVQALKEEDRVLPKSPSPLTAKVIPMIRAGQASAPVYRNILSALDAAIQLLEQSNTSGYTDIITPLVKILQHDTGIEVIDSEALKTNLELAKQMIQEVVHLYDEGHSVSFDDEQERISNFGDVVPLAFFERNELGWRGRVKMSALEDVHSRVSNASKQLAEAIAADYFGVNSAQYNEYGELDISSSSVDKNPIVQDIFNNILAIKAVPSWAKASGDHAYYHPRDRNGKVLNKRYTTERVETALADYIEACETAKEAVKRALMKLSFTLADNNYLPTILQASHMNLIVSTAANHAANSNSKGWNLGRIHDQSSDSAGFIKGLWPYWMDKNDSISNTFDLDGMFLLTAPNMSGKSTVMRSTAAAALLISSGLCAPVRRGSSIRRFDSLFVRGASADVPTENKSAFGAEMGDISSLLRTCGRQSLVFVDEIGRGTSPKDGTSLAGAILERMAQDGMSGMFATHLHGILRFPLSDACNQRLRKKRMAIKENEVGQLKWTYKMEDGVCTNSMALLTASKFGLDDSIIARAEELSGYFSDDESSSIYSSLDTMAPSTNIKELLERSAGNTGKKSVHIPPLYMPPPSLEGSSCVYILQLGGSGTRYYVGETDSLMRRLSQHRARGEDWKFASTIAIQVSGGKSSARSLESKIIQIMSRRGFDLVSIADGTSVRPNQS